MHTLNNLQLNYPQDLHCTPSYAYVHNVLHVSQLIKAVRHVILWCQCYIIQLASCWKTHNYYTIECSCLLRLALEYA